MVSWEVFGRNPQAPSAAAWTIEFCCPKDRLRQFLCQGEQTQLGQDGAGDLEMAVSGPSYKWDKKDKVMVVTLGPGRN